MVHMDDTQRDRESNVPRDPSIEQWRRNHQRDRDAFARLHHRTPASHFELACWLATAREHGLYATSASTSSVDALRRRPS